MRRIKKTKLAIGETNILLRTTAGRDTNKVQKYGIKMMKIVDNSPHISTDSCLVYERNLKEGVDEQKAILKSIEE